jgi:hypothetical protein
MGTGGLVRRFTDQENKEIDDLVVSCKDSPISKELIQSLLETLNEINIGLGLPVRTFMSVSGVVYKRKRNLLEGKLLHGLPLFGRSPTKDLPKRPIYARGSDPFCMALNQITEALHILRKEKEVWRVREKALIEENKGLREQLHSLTTIRQAVETYQKKF